METQLEEIPEEFITDFEDIIVEPYESTSVDLKASEEISDTLLSEHITTTTVIKSKKPTSPWEATEDFEVVIEKIIPVQKGRPAVLKHRDIVLEHTEEISVCAFASVQPVSYEIPKQISRMTFKRPLSIIQGIIVIFSMDWNFSFGNLDIIAWKSIILVET